MEMKNESEEQEIRRPGKCCLIAVAAAAVDIRNFVLLNFPRYIQNHQLPGVSRTEDRKAEDLLAMKGCLGVLNSSLDSS